MDPVKILQTYSEMLKLDTILGRTMRELLWGIVKVLGYFVDAISAVTDKLFVLDKFYNDPKVIDFINSVKPLIVVLFAISLLGIGYQLMFSQTKQFRKIGTNILVAIAVILVLPMGMNKMNELTNLGVNAVKGSPSNLTNEIIKSNVTDILLYDKLNFDDNVIKQLKSGNNINIENIRYIDQTSIIEPDFINTAGIKNKEVFGKRLTTDVDGKLDTTDLNQGWLTFWKEYYYRFDINFLNIIVSLGVLGATLAFTCFKLAKMIFELGYNKFLAILIAPIDINNGQKTKQILQNITSTFIVTFLIAVLLKFYVLFVAVCTKVTGMEGVVLLVAGSFAVIDGPNLVEKLFGIDAGLRSGFKTMAGAYMLGKTAMGGAKSIGKTSKSIAGGVGKMTGAVLGSSAGIASGLYKDMDKDKEKKNADTNKEKSIYPGMAKDKAKANGNLGKGNTVNGSTANTGNSNKKNDTSSPEVDTKGNGDEGHQSIYDKVGNDNEKNNINDNDGQGHKSLYDEMNDSNGESGQPSSINSGNATETNGNEGNGHIAPNNKPKPIQSTPSNNGNGINGQPSANGNISNNTPEPINHRSGNGTEVNSNGGNEGSRHIAPNNTPGPIESTPSNNGNGISERPSANGNISNNTPEPIQQPKQSNNDNSPYQTIGQHQKEKIVNKFQNNPIVKQTRESYNRGENTGQSIRENINNKNK
ncbi:hypothetical protein KPL35_15925 [Clostridium sp. CF011]|uniref:pLS20_p028 family conjugation system transmembrane protein n=1 Tax=Clostridium sp. CF011 TaxID=2843318 RepID=UPI001C0BF547|nr:hypothetical protein [Clostridium sp. CF011]MBU3093547.1 hypothetical protein [Clostridium sp. CF011]WAG71717.1 hypothetical protein LL036_18265 [Clostridium sp. CF011]